MLDSIQVSASNIKGTTAIDRSIPKSAVLKEFRFKFRNGDHKLSSIGALRNEHHLQVKFQDHDGNDPYDVRFEYLDLSQWESELKSDYLQGMATTTSSENLGDHPGMIPVIQGFSLEFTDGHDHHITEISVRIEAQRRFDESSGTGSFALHTAFRDHDQDISYNYQVQILWIPFNRLSAYNEVISGSVDGNYISLSPDKRTSILLQGFSFKYANPSFDKEEGHFVEEVEFGRVDLFVFGRMSDNSTKTNYIYRANYAQL